MRGSAKPPPFRQRVRYLLSGALLLPLAPLLGWGPYTHIEVTRLAWRKVKDSPDLAANDLPERLEGHQDTFARAAPLPDAISTHHVLKGCPLYDYMHNWIPDNAHGIPRFGYALVQECLRRPPADLAVACGWLAHQLADWWAHYAPIAPDGTPATDPDSPGTFTGYANSFRVLGTDFYPEVLEHYRVLDHALLEFLYDLMVLNRPGSETLRTQRPAFFAPSPANPLTRTSERWAARLPRVPPQVVGEMEEEFGRVMRGLSALYSLLQPLRPALQERVDRLISFSATGEEYLELCAQKVVKGVFGASTEEIARWGSPGLAPQREPPFAVRHWPTPQGLYPGTPLLHLAGWLGNLESEVDASFLSRLGEIVRGEPSGPRALGLAFLAGLATARDDGRLPEWLYRLLPPVISLPGVPPSRFPTALADALRAQELVVTFVPAARRDDDPEEGSKALDMASLHLVLNGYEVERYPEYFRVEKERRQGKVIWHCRLLQPLEEGYHQVWASARDRSGVPALPFHYVLDLSTPP